ncbi:MAG: hypothetical protein LBT60_02145 [Oscillospiraceae bacterium]|jgi:2,3-bisphosphoglycerate-independent phosphoglycerate mutase|nr:hypothetical protein [Oscillospiraceae bacterium]
MGGVLCVLIVGDGMADGPVAALGGKTPLAYGPYPHLARLAGQSGVRMACTTPKGFSPGTEVAMPLIAGYDTDVLTGRGPVEAAGMGVALAPGQFAMRTNLVALDDADRLREACPELSDEEGLAAGRLLAADAGIRALLDGAGWMLHPQPGFRQMLTGDGPPPNGMIPPHNVSGARLADHLPEGALEAFVTRGRILLRESGLGVWPWGAGVVPRYQPFAERFGRRGTVISAVPVVRGMARLAGMEAPEVPGATGTLRTDWRAKVAATLAAAWAGCDFVMLHLEAPDDCSHAKDLPGKRRAIDMLDQMTGLLLEGLADFPAFRAGLISDHVTSVETGRHGDAPVPWCVFDSRLPTGTPTVFAERGDAPAEHWSAPLRTLLALS